MTTRDDCSVTYSITRVVTSGERPVRVGWAWEKEEVVEKTRDDEQEGVEATCGTSTI